jgi:hypothetical protein
MKHVSITACLLGAAIAVPAADKAAFSAEMYESGEVMRQIMEIKEVCFKTNALFCELLETNVARKTGPPWKRKVNSSPVPILR